MVQLGGFIYNPVNFTMAAVKTCLIAVKKVQCTR